MSTLRTDFDKLTCDSRSEELTSAGRPYSLLSGATLHTRGGPVTYPEMEWHDHPYADYYGLLRAKNYECVYMNSDRTAVDIKQREDGTWEGNKR
jgi:hypothetical protein